MQLEARILQGDPVAVLKGDTAPKTYPLLRRWAISLFEEAGGRATHSQLGEVALDARAVRDSMGHGMSPIKAEAFAAVPAVITHGALIHHAKNNSTDAYYISAPVNIADQDEIGTVLVKRDANTRRMYLHSVSSKKYLLSTKDSEADAKNASEQNGKASAGDVRRILNRLLNVKL